MPKNSIIELVLLAALWGSSFLFMRLGSPEFGAFLFMFLRTFIASLLLYPLMVAKKQHHSLTGNWHKIFIMGALNTAIPFVLFGYAVLTLSAGVTSILNAMTPMFGALVAYFWLKDKLTLSGMLGLALGFIGVYILMFDKITAPSGNYLLPTIAVLGATICYGISANYTKKVLGNVKPLALAAGSQISSTIMLLPFGLYFIPQTMPSNEAIFAIIALGIFCTGFAYILFFRLISDLGPTKAISVTYLIPVFGLLWGNLFLDEAITINIIIGCATILFGVSLTTGIFTRQRLKA
ncbi:MAG: DMT family transporter [Pseudoalteromonas spongiae]